MDGHKLLMKIWGPKFNKQRTTYHVPYHDLNLPGTLLQW
jgi:hypothetical protein